MVRRCHNLPGREWKRLAMRLGRTAATLRAWVWRKPAAPPATAPVGGVAATAQCEDRRRGRLERPEERERPPRRR